MNAARFMISGLSALALGAVLVGLSFTAPRGVAGQQVPCDATATATVTQQVGQINAFQQVTDTPVATCTAVRLKTHTPSTTPTEAMTNTPVPATPAPTQPAATATPSGGSGGQAVVPPNTGAGPDAGSGLNLELLLAGAALAVIGGGSVVAAARKRR